MLLPFYITDVRYAMENTKMDVAISLQNEKKTHLSVSFGFKE